MSWVDRATRSSRRRVLTGTAVALVTLAGCAAPGSGGGGTGGTLADMEPIVLTTSDINTEQSAVAGATKAFTAAVEKGTGGKVTFQSYFNASLLPGTDALSGTSSGVADITQLSVGYNPQELPVSNYLLKMGAVPSTSYPHGLLAGSPAVWEMYARSEPLRKEYEANNLKILAGAGSNGFTMLCTEPVGSPDDLRGKRIRIGSAQLAPEVEFLGMVPVTMPVGEMYEALQRGVIDCALTVHNLNVEFGLWEVAKEYLPAGFTSFPGVAFVMNLDRWNSLPPDVQQIFRDATYDWWKAYAQGTVAKDVEFAEKGPSEHGVRFADATAVDAQLRIVQQEQLAAVAGSAPAAVGDGAAFVQEFRDRNEAWVKVVTDELGMPLQTAGAAGAQEAYARVASFDFDAYADALRRADLAGDGAR